MLPFSYQVKRINIGGVVGILVFFPTVIPARNQLLARNFTKLAAHCHVGI